MSYFWKIFLGLLSFELCLELAAAQVSPRSPNHTLQMPQAPPAFGYQTVPAFPGLSFYGQTVALVSPPGETNRLFVVQKVGRVEVITNLANPTATVFLDITSQVNPRGEGGLLGLAFHPGYATNGFFYVFYTCDATTAAGTGFHDRLSRFQVSPDNPNLALADSEVHLITQFDEYDNHNGGDVHFGPDGFLYISLGDEGSCCDIARNSQRIDKDFFAGILRIDVDKREGSLPPNPHPAISTNYAVPADNPFVGATNFNGFAVDQAMVRTEFWAVGLRNPWRMSFDAATGYLYCGDVGQDAREEIDIIVRGGNYGWNQREGTIAFPYPNPPPLEPSFIDPILDYQRVGTTGDGSLEGNSVVGGVVYRGARLAQLTGDYVFGDFVSGNIFALRYDGVSAANFRQITTATYPSSFGVDPSNGDILIAEIYNARILRLVYSTNTVGTPLPPTLAETGAFAGLATLAPEAGIVPYDLNVPFWSDHARKSRWFSVPDTNLTMQFSPTGNWSFPTGTVWIKHFELEMTNGVPESAKRLETRFLVRNPAGVYGVTYRWGNSPTNATLVPPEGMDETFIVQDGGTTRTQTWHYPSRSECVICHTPAGGLALGFNTAQINRDFNYGGTVTNQLSALSQAGYFGSSVGNPASLPALAHPTNSAFSIEDRARSYLAANCVQCHQPGGSALGNWDARFATPIAAAGIIDGALVNNLGNPTNRVMKPGSLDHSMILTRISQLGSGHMPPLATSELNSEAIELLSNWIMSGLGAVTNPPSIVAQPQSQIVNLGSNATFSITSSGTPPLAYQWYFNGVTLLVGATNSSLTVTNVQDDDAGSYSVVISNGTSVTSSNALLTVNHLPVAGAPVLERFAFEGVKWHMSQFLGSDPDGDFVSLYSAGPVSLQGGTVTTNADWVIYTPPPGFTNADSFTFAVSDGRGGISLGTATVIVTFDNAIPQNFRAELLGNGSVRLIFDGIRDRTYSVEFTENLESPSWQKLSSVTADENGVFVYMDSLPNGSPQRFYRAAWP